MNPAEPSISIPHDPYAAFRFFDFRLLLVGRFVAVFGEMMVRVAIGYEIYERTSDPFALGLVGLVQVLPVVALSLIAGHVADRFNRRKLIIYTQLGLGICALGLAVLSAGQRPLPLIYFCLFMIGVLRAFNDPASSILLPQSVPPEAFLNAATWSSSSWQLASIVGPAIGGLLIAIFKGGEAVFILDFIIALIYIGFLLMMKGRPIAQSKEEMTVESLLAGLRFIWRTREMMAAITLDLFAVLFGGAVALLPVYAKDILHVGPEGLGLLLAAPSVGGVVMVFLTANLPPFKKAGKTLLWAVIGFGLATIVFGVSTWFPLSLLMLALLGALDNISVVIRSTLALTLTPDQMRGRVSAVNNVFIGMSNEMGGFESGLVASLSNPVFAVVSGGIGTIIVVGLVAWYWPEIRRLGKLSEMPREA